MSALLLEGTEGVWLAQWSQAAPMVEGEQNPREVVKFMDVYKRSYCRPIETLVDIFQEYPDEIEYIFKPSCVPLMRCGGCCNDESLECVPTEEFNITMQIMRIKPHQGQHIGEMSFLQHSRCECRCDKPRRQNLTVEMRPEEPRPLSSTGPLPWPAVTSGPILGSVSPSVQWHPPWLLTVGRDVYCTPWCSVGHEASSVHLALLILGALVGGLAVPSCIALLWLVVETPQGPVRQLLPGTIKPSSLCHEKCRH
ncbi:Vascular endothelial growth factor A [Fukomys damarensis]|uniref:Vascular permeability factor n=1 Tax=Fukomys damarensis TaxID=885580 RepID=A0A091E105_FUKDA|nr:Vascular endothelial growth factor A [Fukomys damarensis]